MNGKTQYNQIQILRAIAILMVVIHHTLNNLPDCVGGGYLLIVANADVSIFFLISSYLFEKGYEKYKRDIRTFLKRKAKQLLLPYLFWSLILYVGAKIIYDIIGGKAIDVIQNLGFFRLSWTSIVFNIITFQDYYVKYLWFIYVLFLYFVVSIFIGRRLNHWWCVVALLLFASTVNYYFELPDLLWKFLQHSSDFLIGRVVFSKLKPRFFEGRKCVVILISVIVSFMFVILLQNISADLLIINWGITFGKHILYWTICLICYFISGEIMYTRCSPIAECIGNYSYDIYLMHTPYIVPVVAKLMLSVSGNWIIAFLVTVVLGISIPLLISKYVIRKVPLARTVALGK